MNIKWKIKFKKGTTYTYIFPTISYSRDDWKQGFRRFWVEWLIYQICFMHKNCRLSFSETN